jgi:hypothetical protein
VATLDQPRDYAGAEQELRPALRPTENSGPVFTPKFANTLRIMLAKVLVERGDKVQPREFVQIVCHAPSTK